MAYCELKSPNSSGIIYLRDYHTFGRREGLVDTHLAHAFVSKFHAVIEWREPNWLIKDVSKNGIKLNNKIMPARKITILKKDDIIDFAGDGSTLLQIKNLDAPVPLLIDKSAPKTTIQLSENILLPDEAKPELALFLCPDRDQWFSESVSTGQEQGPYQNSDGITFANKQWQFLLVREDDATSEFNPTQTSLEDILFRFDLSQDEESTNLSVFENGIEHDLGERSHHYLLVHLLRYRATNKYTAGWLDNQLLHKELGLEETHANIQIFRARKQISSALPNIAGHSKLIERKRGAIRTGIRLFEIYKEGKREI